MDKEYENECVHECQSNLINMRKKYIKTIVKLNTQSSKIESKLLEKVKLLPNDSQEFVCDFSMDEDLLRQFNNSEHKEQMNTLKHKIKNLEQTATRTARIKNCDIYKKIFSTEL